MSTNELHSRKSRYSNNHEENSSLCNRSINNLSVDLPQQRRKHNLIEQELMARRNGRSALTVNLASTKYPILQEVCAGEGLNWKVESFGESRNWVLKWCDTGVVNETLQRMAPAQRVNHFPSMSVISRKNTLALTLAKMKEQFPSEYDYYPRTFLYPNDTAKIYHYFAESRKRGLLKTFIVKPEAGCQGRGIYLTQNPADFEKEERCVIQKYIANPLLYKGLKFDLRIYVLLASLNPLRIYLYNEGLVRFATEEYELPDSSNLDNFFMHLTNYAINKSHPNYQYNYSVNDMSHGHKKSLAEFFKSLKELGYRANAYWSQIKDNIIKTILAAQPYLLANYRLCRPQESTYNMCFQLLGFDFMIDNQDRVFLLEVNHTPSFSTDTPLDHIIKKNLIKDTLLMMAPSQEELRCLEELERLKQREKFIKLKQGGDGGKEREGLVRMINDIRSQNEESFKGTYEMIYPHKNQAKQDKYTQIAQYALKSLNQAASSANLSSFDIRSRIIKEAPKSKVVSKQQLAKIIPETTKKNLIYNYNNIKHPTSSSKKALQTLPVERIRADSHPREKFSSGNSTRMLSSKQKLKTEAGSTREVRSNYIHSNYRSQQKRSNIFDSKPKARQQSSKAVVQKSPGKELNTFTKRIRAYKTPLMF